jgi:hypothetical protein
MQLVGACLSLPRPFASGLDVHEIQSQRPSGGLPPFPLRATSRHFTAQRLAPLPAPPPRTDAPFPSCLRGAPRRS